MRVDLQPAYVLHSRPYRDSSALLEVLTAEYGRLSLVARGARRRSRGGSQSASLQPFIPLLLSFSGRGELKTLTGSESVGKTLTLRGPGLFSGMYVNELLLRLLHPQDSHTRLFVLYGETLEGLAGEGTLEDVLRRFELALLDELGFGLDLRVDGSTGEQVQAGHWYRFHPEFGMVAQTAAEARPATAFPGADLLNIAAGEYGGSARLTAKRLLRQVLANYIGDKPLKSRDLFRAALDSAALDSAALDSAALDSAALDSAALDSASRCK